MMISGEECKCADLEREQYERKPPPGGRFGSGYFCCSAKPGCPKRQTRPCRWFVPVWQD